jgi:hypothetical protein
MELLRELGKLSGEVCDLIDNMGDIEKLASGYAGVETTLYQLKMLLDGNTNGQFSELVDTYTDFILARQDNRNKRAMAMMEQRKQDAPPAHVPDFDHDPEFESTPDAESE